MFAQSIDAGVVEWLSASSRLSLQHKEIRSRQLPHEGLRRFDECRRLVANEIRTERAYVVNRAVEVRDVALFFVIQRLNQGFDIRQIDPHLIDSHVFVDHRNRQLP